MNSSNKPITWHPGYYASIIEDDQLVLTGEPGSYLFQGERYRNLYRWIDRTKSISEIIVKANTVSEQAALLCVIDDLMKRKIITEVESNSVYFQPAFDSNPLVYSFNDGLLEVQQLSKHQHQDLPEQLASTLDIRTPAGIVVVDDYLDPRLEDINRVYMRKKNPWLLLKPTGSQPMVGPYFNPGRPQAPCWACLSDRLLHNQPVRRWLQNMEGSATIPIPVSYEKETTDAVVSVVVELVKDFFHSQNVQCLKSIARENLAITEHPVQVRPQCAHCGEADMWSDQRRAPITLNPSSKAYTTDGGVRSVSPSQTIASLQQSISPLTGVVHGLTPLAQVSDKCVSIYRSSFFKIPGIQRKPSNDDFLQISLGKGVSQDQSKASALCESIERHAVQYCGDESHFWGTPAGSKRRTILPHQLAGYSESQYDLFENPSDTSAKKIHAVKRYSSSTPLHWTPVWSLTHQEHVHLPLTYCYANTPFAEEHFSRFNSNGCAAGNTTEEALLQGLLELVERDAIAIWWYNRILRPSVEIDTLDPAVLGRLEHTLSTSWDYWVLDITHDFHIPVMAAIGKNRKDGSFRFGFGCHIDSILACQRALTELCQLVAIEDRGPATFDFNALVEEPFLFPSLEVPKTDLSDFNMTEYADVKDDVLFCVARAKQLGLETVAVAYVHPDLPIRTVKVIIPGLCHIWPQLGNERLYQVPVTHNWREIPLKENQLNPIPLFI